MKLVEMLHDEAASEESSATRGAMGRTCLDSEVLSSANEGDVVLCIQTAAATDDAGSTIQPSMAVRFPRMLSRFFQS